MPHAFARNWIAAKDDWADSFRLLRITGTQLLAARESARIFERWVSANAVGTPQPGDVHPAMAVDRSRCGELSPVVESIYEKMEQSGTVVLGEFLYSSLC